MWSPRLAARLDFFTTHKKGVHTTENVSLATYLAQAEDAEVAEAFGSFMHTAARTAFMAGLFKEVEALCGKAYHPLSEGKLRKFLKGKSAQALASLEEAGDELLAVHRLGVPSTLNKTLLNTNCIENPFRNVRAKLRRVSRWQSETQMASKWMAYALLEAERGFRRVTGYAALPKPENILQSISPPPPKEGEKASPSRLDPEPSTEYKS